MAAGTEAAAPYSWHIPEKPAAKDNGQLSINYGLLWGMVDSYFGLLGIPGTGFLPLEAPSFFMGSLRQDGSRGKGALPSAQRLLHQSAQERGVLRLHPSCGLCGQGLVLLELPQGKTPDQLYCVTSCCHVVVVSTLTVPSLR